MGVVEYSVFPLLVGQVCDMVVQAYCKALSFGLVMYDYVAVSDMGFPLLYQPPSYSRRFAVTLCMVSSRRNPPAPAPWCIRRFQL
jgi:hypothetical protein